MDRKFLIPGDLIRVLTIRRDIWAPAFRSCNNGHEDESDDVIGVVTGFTEKRVIIQLLHPVSGIVIYRSDKNIERVEETAASA